MVMGFSKETFLFSSRDYISFAIWHDSVNNLEIFFRGIEFVTWDGYFPIFLTY